MYVGTGLKITKIVPDNVIQPFIRWLINKEGEKLTAKVAKFPQRTQST
jgi:hypothetical protein